MKTSIILITLILLNTSVLISEPLAQMVKGINTWLFVGLEIVLLIVYFMNQIIKDIKKIDFSDVNLMDSR